jgi:hypothetical protein
MLNNTARRPLSSENFRYNSYPLVAAERTGPEPLSCIQIGTGFEEVGHTDVMCPHPLRAKTRNRRLDHFAEERSSETSSVVQPVAPTSTFRKTERLYPGQETISV